MKNASRVENFPSKSTFLDLNNTPEETRKNGTFREQNCDTIEEKICLGRYSMARLAWDMRIGSFPASGFSPGPERWGTHPEPSEHVAGMFTTRLSRCCCVWHWQCLRSGGSSEAIAGCGRSVLEIISCFYNESTSLPRTRLPHSPQKHSSE